MSASATPTLAIVVKGFPRLSETFIARELEALEQRGLDFSLHALRNPDKDAPLTRYGVKTACAYLPEYLHHAPLIVSQGIRSAFGLPGFFSAFQLFLKDLRHDRSRARLRRFGQACVLADRLRGSAQHIHCHFAHSPASVVRYCARMLGITYSISAHAKDVWTDPEWDLQAKLKDAAFVVTCNRAALARLTAIAEPSRLQLAYHGTNHGLIVAKPIAQFRDGSRKDAPLQLISVARAVEKKGLGILLQALALLPRGLHFQLNHFGDGELIESLRHQAVSLGIADRVTFHGAQPHARVIAAMDTSDIFVFPALVSASGDRDGIPNALIEANARGICVISCNSGSTSEVVRDGATGLLIESGEAAALAHAIESCGREPKRREALAQSALENNRCMFDGKPGYDWIAEALRSQMAGR